MVFLEKNAKKDFLSRISFALGAQKQSYSNYTMKIITDTSIKGSVGTLNKLFFVSPKK